MGDPSILPRRHRILVLVAVVALVAAFALLFRTASGRSTESVDPVVEKESTPLPDSTSPRRGSAWPATEVATASPHEPTAAEHH